mmetsp:Transcript_14133/g.31990  ORF Transcript_14133/g.31990 Transcript_14133/m.31990 type:complete len:217 (-) Transcript_14133:338-988(-)
MAYSCSILARRPLSACDRRSKTPCTPSGSFVEEFAVSCSMFPIPPLWLKTNRHPAKKPSSSCKGHIFRCSFNFHGLMLAPNAKYQEESPFVAGSDGFGFSCPRCQRAPPCESHEAIACFPFDCCFPPAPFPFAWGRTPAAPTTSAAVTDVSTPPKLPIAWQPTKPSNGLAETLGDLPPASAAIASAKTSPLNNAPSTDGDVSQSPQTPRRASESKT